MEKLEAWANTHNRVVVLIPQDQLRAIAAIARTGDQPAASPAA